MQASRAWLSKLHDDVTRRPEEQALGNVAKHCRNAASSAAHAAREARTASHVAMHSLSGGAPAHGTVCSAAHSREQTSSPVHAGVFDTPQPPRVAAPTKSNATAMRRMRRLSAHGPERRKAPTVNVHEPQSGVMLCQWAEREAVDPSPSGHPTRSTSRFTIGTRSR
jgi:hypothetical protein